MSHPDRAGQHADPLCTVDQCDYAPGTGHLTGGFDRHHMAMLGFGPPGAYCLPLVVLPANAISSFSSPTNAANFSMIPGFPSNTSSDIQ